jgi:peptidoglycan/xylan/chitin deacetylase (PgdA/CDA1 family)
MPLARVREGLLAAGRRFGWNRALGESSWRRRRLLILCYHGLALDEEDRWDSELFLPPSRFAAQMRMLAESGCHVLSLDEGVQRLAAGTLPERSVAITFDDGVRDFYALAWPELARHRFPATVYLTTWYAGQPRPAFGVFLKYLMWKAGRWDAAAFATLRRQAAACASLEDRDRWLAARAAEWDVDLARLLDLGVLHVMGEEPVAELAATGLVHFELHTHRHRTPHDEALFRREIADNRRVIQNWTGRTPTHFCYPSGQWDKSFLPWLRAEGVRSATTCENDLASPAHDPLLLPRFVVTGATTPERFADWLGGAASLTSRAHWT